jgi:hypothetical protein
MKTSHMWICGAFIGIAVVVVALGGSAWILIPALGCMAMMGAMMWMMMRMGSGNGRGPQQ